MSYKCEYDNKAGCENCTYGDKSNKKMCAICESYSRCPLKHGCSFPKWKENCAKCGFSVKKREVTMMEYTAVKAGGDRQKSETEGVIDMGFIDRDEVVKIIKKYDDRGLTLDEVARVTDGIAKEIEAMPTVDAIQVVRCKDCMHHKGLTEMEKFQYGNNVVWCKRPCSKRKIMRSNDFCSYGERKGG